MSLSFKGVEIKTAFRINPLILTTIDILQRQTLFHGAWQHDFANQQPNNFFNQGNWPSKHTCLEQKEGTPEI